MPTVFHSSQARLRHGLLTNATPWRHKQEQQRQYRQQLQQNASNECLAIIIQFNFQQTSVAAPFLISLYPLFALPTACVNVWRPLSLSLFSPVSRSLSLSLYAVFIVEYGCVCVCVWGSPAQLASAAICLMTACRLPGLGCCCCQENRQRSCHLMQPLRGTLGWMMAKTNRKHKYT